MNFAIPTYNDHEDGKSTSQSVRTDDKVLWRGVGRRYAWALLDLAAFVVVHDNDEVAVVRDTCDERSDNEDCR